MKSLMTIYFKRKGCLGAAVGIQELMVVIVKATASTSGTRDWQLFWLSFTC